MCRETIRKAVVQKFNETKKWNCKDIEELYDKIEDRKEANEIVNSLIDLLPSLRTGEAIIVGEAIKIPSRVRLKLNVPRPTSDDPKLVERWQEEHKTNEENYKTVVTRIRQQKF
jgi:hypothetical protein